MRPRPRTIAALLLALMLMTVPALAGCDGSGSTGDSTLKPNEDPVPDGMPVMYEFYTDT